MDLLKDIDQQEVLKSLKSVNDLGNSVLYNMCKENFTHDTPEEIIAKTNIIGRVYAVALDRGKDKNKTEAGKRKHITDDFFPKVIVPIFMRPRIGTLFSDLDKLNNQRDNIKTILYAHYYLMHALKKINKEEKRSFSSKYFHFHFPHLFFIYDSRANPSLNEIVSGKIIKDHRKIKMQDDKYASFFNKSLFLQKEIFEQFGIELSPRQLDNYLLIFANENLRNKGKKKIITTNK